MRNAAATLSDVTSFDGRVSPRGACRRIVNGLVIGLATVAAACALTAAVTMAAAWIISAALSTNPDILARPPIGAGALASAGYDVIPASAADVLGGVSTRPADSPDVTFDARWTRRTGWASTAPLVPQGRLERTGNVRSLPYPLQAPRRQPKADMAHAPDLTHVAKLATPPLPASTAERPGPARQAHDPSPSPPDPDSRTAVYDIAAHTVYLPNGVALEAHSGLGSKLDDPHSVSLRNRGPTPPNVYELALRPQLFHGVRAIRLNPVGEDHMFGRDGILAHSYMLGANGQSNGCVSFRDYPAFLHAVMRGEVDRLVVVPSLGSKSWRTALANGGSTGTVTRSRQ
jgi:hypothetical protein